MKITSWNINQFLKKENWNNLKGKYEEKKKIREDSKNYYFRYIEKHLNSSKKDLFFLHEVPFNAEAESNGKLVRSEQIEHIYTELEKKFSNGKFEMLTYAPTDLSKMKNRCYFKTVAIFHKNDYKEVDRNLIDKFFPGYQNRVVAVKGDKEIIIGVHIPVQCGDMWVSLLALHRKLSRECKDKKIIYVGDFNTYDDGTINRIAFDHFLSEGLVDVWLAKGNPNEKETHDKHRRLDYMLMTREHFWPDKCSISIDDNVRTEGLSDHSALIYTE